jgi:uncharacterized membrane protein YccC
VSAALRANRDYLDLMIGAVADGRRFDHAAREAKRRAERANAAVFSSINRLNGDPKNQREGLEHIATLANGNQRIIRAVNVLALHVGDGRGWRDSSLNRFRTLARESFDLVAAAVESESGLPANAEPVLRSLEAEPLNAPADDSSARWAFAQLTQVTTELCALLEALQEAAPARA